MMMNKKVLLFPSAWSNEAVFTSQIEALQDRYKIIFPNIHKFDDIEAMADFVASEYKNVYAMLGLSMGGFVVQDLLCRYPDFSEKVILMGTYCHTHDEPTKAFYRGLIDQVQAGGFEDVINIFTNAVISKSRFEDGALREKISNLPRALGQEYCINHHKACISWQDHTEVLKAIKADVLILAGEEDGAVPITDLQTLHDLIPGAQFKTISRAGHLIGLEEPEQVNQAIQSFLKD